MEGFVQNKLVSMHLKSINMKKIIGLFLAAGILLSACGPKPYYKTAKGKKKTKYYNDIQFGGKSASEMKKPKN
jgi:hypothetical protein